MKNLKKVFFDAVFMLLLLAVMLVSCGFSGETTICGSPHTYEVQAKGVGCSVRETPAGEQAVFEVTIEKGKSARVHISGILEGVHAQIGELGVQLSRDVACSEVTVQDNETGEREYEFDLGIPDDMANGTKFDFMLMHYSDGRDPETVMTARIIVRRVQPDKMPGTGDYTAMTLWLLLFGVSGAGLLLMMRRREN